MINSYLVSETEPKYSLKHVFCCTMALVNLADSYQWFRLYLLTPFSLEAAFHLQNVFSVGTNPRTNSDYFTNQHFVAIYFHCYTVNVV